VGEFDVFSDYGWEKIDIWMDGDDEDVLALWYAIM
jgi:hypothetical protein